MDSSMVYPPVNIYMWKAHHESLPNGFPHGFAEWVFHIQNVNSMGKCLVFPGKALMKGIV